MKLKFITISLLFVVNTIAYSQNRIELNAFFDVEKKAIHITQTINYKNSSNDTLSIIYLNDWNHSYSYKKSPLGKRFIEEYNKQFHFAKREGRGFTTIDSIQNSLNESLNFRRLKTNLDIIEVELQNDLLPQQSYNISLSYTLVIPDDTFTSFGVAKNRDFNLNQWYITPSVYNGNWQYYSNKNLDDLYTPKSDITLQIEYPKIYSVISELNTIGYTEKDSTKTMTLSGKNRVNSKLFLNKSSTFEKIKTDNFTIVSNITDIGLKPPHEKAIITDKITRFITKNLGEYPHENLLVSDIDYNKDPLYGLNQLPSFIRPFPDNFQYEIKLLKTALKNYLDNTLLVNSRKDYWLKEGLQIYFLIKYIEENYPNTKLLGKLAKVWGVRSFHISDLNYNEKYNLFYMQMARTNRDQALTISKDSLIKFNANIGAKFKAGLGLKYLDDFINADVLEHTISQYLSSNKTKATSSKDFETLLKQNTNKNIDWFFTDYLNTRKKIDFKIKDVVTTKDSVTFTIKNNRNHTMPVSFYTLKEGKILSKDWLENIGGSKTFTIPKKDANTLALNYEKTAPEINLRDNQKSINGFLNSKPLQLKLFKDVENPNYNQVFFMPLIEFRNIYDGLTLGTKVYNKAILRKPFHYRFAPQYATKSRAITGSSQLLYRHNFEDKNLYEIRYELTASYSSFAENAFVTKIVPNITFKFRDNDNLRSNKYERLQFRYSDIQRTLKRDAVVEIDEPNYGIFNVRYIKANPGLVDFQKWYSDLQFAKNFGKLAINFEYRKLYDSNRQINLRFFAGTFLYNNTDTNSDYFSFALDRPTDYLFDYNYLGRSESTGLFSQQIIIADGGFKSKLDTPFGNLWLTTVNASTTIWNYIEAYGDIGLVKNKGIDPVFVYDSGIRLNLVTDYFELYFPMYSNLGWEIGEKNYNEKIRFKFTVDPEALFGLFRRKWY